MANFSDFVVSRKELLRDYLHEPMLGLAAQCAEVWNSRQSVDEILCNRVMQAGQCAGIPSCELLYAMDIEGMQISSNISRDHADSSAIGRDLSMRPYLSTRSESGRVSLSDVYISQATRRSCLTAICRVMDGDAHLGFIATDFRLSALPQEERESDDCRLWQQIKGDPSVRQTLFMQERAVSPMDEKIDDVLSTIDELVVDRGVFHTKIHFSSSRATLWLYDAPYRYRVHVLDEIINPSVCLAYPGRGYLQDAMIPSEEVSAILDRFKQLRMADETVYLRDGLLSVINGMVGIHFSCDGQHYMPYEEFLQAGDEFWFGAIEA